MRLKNRIGGLLGLVVALALMGMVAPAPAYADDHSGSIISVGYLQACLSGYFCAWPQDSDSNGGEFSSGVGWDGWDKDWKASSDEHPGPQIDNNSEFWANHGMSGTYDGVRMFRYSYYGGYSTCIPRGAHYNNAPGSDPWDNVPSSHHWTSDC